MLKLEETLLNAFVFSLIACSEHDVVKSYLDFT